MSTEPVRFLNRYSGEVETEAIYGEPFLRWIYEGITGRFFLHAAAKRSLFSKWYGWRMSRPKSRERIAPFIRDYGLDPNEFAEDPDTYRTFNEFFYRKLRPEARPIETAPKAIVFPADGRHLAVPDLEKMPGFFVKGQRFHLESLLANRTLAESYAGGTLILSRLCPVDYHRYHFVDHGAASAPRLIEGPLFSVSPIALRKKLEYLTSNKRALTLLQTDHGQVVQMEIGATCVGSICSTFQPGNVERGQEKGYFAFGGSATISLFRRGAINPEDDLLEASEKGMELYAKVGDQMARWN